jgi:hypothetical protein
MTIHSTFAKSTRLAAATIVAALTAYVLSVGPVFLCLSHHPDTPLVRVCAYYKPLFDACPTATTAYLRVWHVSEIEAFVLLSMAHNRR